MAETSFFWQNTTPGDASHAPYSADEFGRNTFHFIYGLRNVLTSMPYFPAIIKGHGSQLVVTNTSGITFTVGTGSAVVDGVYYENDEEVSLSLTGADGYYYILLRKDFSAQTVRIATLGPGSPPTLTRNSSGIFEIPLAYIQKSGGTIASVQDVRSFIRPEYHSLGARYTLLGRNDPGGIDDYDGSPPYGWPNPPLLPMRMVLGTSNWAGNSFTGNISITLPFSFVMPPAIIATAKDTSGQINVVVYSHAENQFQILWEDLENDLHTSVDIMWAAFGQIETGN